MAEAILLHDGILDSSILNHCEPMSIFKKRCPDHVLLYWRISSFEEMERYTTYRKDSRIENECYTFEIDKYSEALRVHIKSEYIPHNANLEITIIDGKSKTFTMKSAVEIQKSVYVATVPYKNFQSMSRNYFLDEYLLVVFKYARDDLQLRAMKIFNNKLRYLYHTGDLSDFLIHIKEHSFRAHKFVLRDRSPFFKELFQENKGIKQYQPDFNFPLILHEVLVYIYSGELEKEMNLEDMLRVYELARKFKVKGLCSVCHDYFTLNITLNNYKVMARCSVQLESTILKNIVVRFLVNNIEEIL